MELPSYSIKFLVSKFQKKNLKKSKLIFFFIENGNKYTILANLLKNKANKVETKFFQIYDNLTQPWYKIDH